MELAVEAAPIVAVERPPVARDQMQPRPRVAGLASLLADLALVAWPEEPDADERDAGLLADALDDPAEDGFYRSFLCRGERDRVEDRRIHLDSPPGVRRADYGLSSCE